jgi:hypothetical protein
MLAVKDDELDVGDDDDTSSEVAVRCGKAWGSHADVLRKNEPWDRTHEARSHDPEKPRNPGNCWELGSSGTLVWQRGNLTQIAP